MEAFGKYDGVDIYNQLVDRLGEQRNQCLPLVNICIRVWMDMLINNNIGDLWADLSPLDFDKWRADATRKA